MYFDASLSLLREKGGYIYCECMDDYTYSFGEMSLMGSEDNKWPTLLKIDKTGNADTSQYGWGIPLGLMVGDDWCHVESKLSFDEKPKGEEYIKEAFRIFLFNLFMTIYGPFNMYLMPDPTKASEMLIKLLKDEGVLRNVD